MERESTKVQTTLRVPESLMKVVRELLDCHQVEGTSVNDVVVAALQRFVDEVHEKMIDAAFAEMGRDEEYLAENRILTAQFAQADWESLPTETNRAANAR